MIGTNGWPGSAADIEMWHKMGISWGRGSVGPGQPDAPTQPMRVDKTGNRYDSDLPSVVLRNNQNGIRSLLFLGYTPRWNARVPGDTKSAPEDVDAWERYVDAVVRKYSGSPYGVRHFQIWNEAAGRLSGGLPQATFWHGPNFNKNEHQSGPYDRAMQDYVERIHIPAARIIRRYGAYVVYGGWPDQGGLDNLDQWLDYRSPRLNERMADWVDYLDTHYLPVADLDRLYERYVKQGPARGLWQTEIGDRYMLEEHYLPRYFFEFAVWALARNWDDPDKYLSMVYHWDGYEAHLQRVGAKPDRAQPDDSRRACVPSRAASIRSGSDGLRFAVGQGHGDPGERAIRLAHRGSSRHCTEVGRRASALHRCVDRRCRSEGRRRTELE